LDGGFEFSAGNGAIAVGVGAAKHHPHAGIADFVRGDLAVAVLIGPHGHVDHLRGIAHRAAGAAWSTGTAGASFLLGDVAVAVGVELRQVGDSLAEFGLADGTVAVGIERGEELVAAAEPAATEAAAFFTFAFAATTQATAGAAFATLTSFSTLTARGVFFAEFGAGVASAGGLGERRRGRQQAEGEGPTCFGHDLVLS
jgi:hypothetical protein